MFLIAGIVVSYIALAGLVIRENLTFIVYESMVAAFGVIHVPVILHLYHRHHYLSFLTFLAARLDLVSLFLTQPYRAIVLVVVPMVSWTASPTLHPVKHAMRVETRISNLRKRMAVNPNNAARAEQYNQSLFNQIIQTAIPFTIVKTPRQNQT